jgi:FAD/FMN-containing dehydrogenase
VLRPGPDGLHHPSTEAEVQELVRWARGRGLPVRVRGTGHSVDDAIYTSARRAGRAGESVDVALDRYAGIAVDAERREVTVEAGCRLGGDPRDRSGRGSVEAGLCWQLEQRGLALPVTAGVTHQTVAGFLMTGSAGGSRDHALTEQVVAMRLVDASGEVHELSPDRDPDLFDAAGVSMGLLGIVSTVTLRCVERFDVEGEERIATVAAAPFDLGADGPAGVDGFLRENEYARMYWWPQEGVDKLSIWTARAVPGPPSADPRPYRLLPEVAGSTTPAQAIAGTAVGMACRRRRFGRAAAAVYNAFMPDGESQSFRDAWWRVLPMDDELDERFFPSTWSELWLPAEATGAAMRRLRDHYRLRGFAATGAYTTEVYGAPASRFWLSPGHGRESTRLNVCWHERGRGDPRETYFPQFWELLGDLDFRLHWGKHRLPDPRRAAAHAHAGWPRLADFLELRRQMDPEGTFLSDYWREQLGVPAPARRAAARPEPSAPPAPPAAGSPGRRWPLLVRMRPSDASFAERAPYVIDIHRTVAAAPEDVFDAIVMLRGATEWLPDFVRARWVEGPNERGEQVVEETFKFMTQRVRTFVAERGRHWMASIDACTLPLGREMMEDLELEPLDGGRTMLRWRYYYEPHPLLRPARRLLHHDFDRMLRLSLDQLEEHLAAGRAAGARPARSLAPVG